MSLIWYGLAVSLAYSGGEEGGNFLVQMMSTCLPSRSRRRGGGRHHRVHIFLEMKQGLCVCPLSWSLHCNFTDDGKCNERGWACTPHPHQPGIILPSWLNVRQKAAVATLYTLWSAPCGLRPPSIFGLFSCGGHCTNVHVSSYHPILYSYEAAVEPQSTYFPRDETGLVCLPAQLDDGKCNERGWACTPHPYQQGLILPSWLNVRQKAAVATLCTLWSAPCGLRPPSIFGLFSCGGHCTNVHVSSYHPILYSYDAAVEPL